MFRIFKSLSVQVVLALTLGLIVGAACRGAPPVLEHTFETIEALGALWLNLLRMTVVPLVFSLLVVGIASVSDAAATGRLAARALGWFAVLVLAAAVYGMAGTEVLLNLWPLSPQDAQALVGGTGGAAAIPPAPSLAEWIQGLAPANPIKAAAEDAILPLVVFAVFMGFAATRLADSLREPLINLFNAVAETMVVVVRWVLLAAPLGVFALALGVGLRAGIGAGGVLLHYVAVVSIVTAGITLAGYLVAVAFGRVRLFAFAKAAAPVQAVAFSTQSSLACLPAMVERVRDDLGVPPRVAGLVLPLAVAVFRMTSPVANLAVALFVCKVYGVEPNLLQLAGAVFVAFAVSVGSVGLPGQVSFIASIAPICLALGAPIGVLPILLAVEVVPDIFRTLGNVTADMAVTTIVARTARPEPATGSA